MLSESAKARDTCASKVPNPYYFLKEARYEGSGGASGVKNKNAGGAGGGIIWLSTTGTINLEKSTLSANGFNGTTDTFLPSNRGSGGGAGGSVQLVMRGLKGNGAVSVKGGSGSVRGGGGGSGGRVVVHFLRAFMKSSYPE